ncbi:hypothetical protein K1719_027898 [Acacia pycnantha]|nr:hypothetical protein K1719_027898 [Acacia pycnantha]
MRLDRAICNSDWVQFFPHYGVDHLPKVFSDHRPILINLNLDPHFNPSNKPFRFMAPWLTHPDFSPLVDRIWSANGDILNCLAAFTEEVQRWNHGTFGAIGKRKRKLLNRINGIQKRLEGQPSNHDFLSDLDLSLRDEFENVCFQEELLWLQKSSSEKICLGDRNTHYYHMKALIRRKKNHITQLKNNEGIWISDDSALVNLARDFFKKLYSLNDSASSPLSLRGVFPMIPEHSLLALERAVSTEEVKQSLFEIVSIWYEHHNTKERDTLLELEENVPAQKATDGVTDLSTFADHPFLPDTSTQGEELQRLET